MRYTARVKYGTDAPDTKDSAPIVEAAPRHPVIWSSRIVISSTPKERGNRLDCLAAEIAFRIKVAAGLKELYLLSEIQDMLLENGFVAHYAEEPEVLRLWVDDPEEGEFQLVLYLED